MNILIVDDQIKVIDSIVSNINWEKLGITNVMAANSSLEAKDIIRRIAIDILITDIEMPVEDGIALVRWCRNNGFSFECIFLTSHPDFHYVKQALNLQAFDYVLQPSRYEDVENCIRRAIEKVRSNRTQNQYLRLGQLAYENRDDSLTDIFSDWIHGENIDIEAQLAKLQVLSIDLQADSKVIFSLIHILSWHDVPKSNKTVLNGLWKIAEDIFRYVGMNVVLFSPETNHYLCLLYGDENLKSFSDYRHYFNVMQNEITSQFHCTSDIITGEAIDIVDLYSAYKNASKKTKYTHDDNNKKQNSIIYADLQKELPKSIKDKTFEDVIAYIQENIDKPITSEDIASYIHFSPDYVTRIIKKKSGKTSVELITSYKMEYAKKLLETTDDSISEVAYKVGYNSSSYFSVVYKTYYGISPKQQRRKDN